MQQLKRIEIFNMEKTDKQKRLDAIMMKVYTDCIAIYEDVENYELCSKFLDAKQDLQMKLDYEI